MLPGLSRPGLDPVASRPLWLAGSAEITGELSATLAATSGSLLGHLVITGELTGTLVSTSGVLDGTLVSLVTGELTGTLVSTSGVLDGTLVSLVTGELTGTLAATTGALHGQIEILATLTGTLEDAAGLLHGDFGGPALVRFPLVGPDGAPLVGVTVRVYALSPFGSEGAVVPGVAAEAVTDGDGIATLYLARSGSVYAYRVEVDLDAVRHLDAELRVNVDDLMAPDEARGQRWH